MFHSLFVCSFCCLLNDLSVPFDVCVKFLLLLNDLLHSLFVCSFCCLLIDLSVPFSVVFE